MKTMIETCLLCMLLFLCGVKAQSCNYVYYVPSFYYDSYTCCYKLTTTPATISLPTTQAQSPVNPGNPLVSISGNNLGTSANGNYLYFESSTGYYTSGYYDSNGIYRTGIQLYYVTYTNGSVYINQNAMQSSDQSLINTLAGKNAMLWFYVNGFESCARFTFAGASNAASTQTQATAVGFNGNITGCGSTSTTNYLLNVTNTQSVLSPNATLSYNATTGKIDISVIAWYIPQFATYSIRFSPFNVSSDDINKTSTCENRVASSYVGISFSNWWTHLPNAIINAALGTTATLAYGPANNWTFNFIDCSRVSWTRSFSLSTLQSCKNSSGNSEINVNDQSTTSGFITYSGNLYIQLVAPIFTGYGTGSKAGYTSISWTYPFQYTFQSATTATTLVSAGGSYLTVTVTSVSIIASGPDAGKMYISLQTKYYPDQYGYVLGATLSSTTGANLLMSGVPSTIIQANPVIQNFAWVSATNQSVYDGTYTFTFPTYNCPGLSNASLCVLNNIKSQPILVYLRQQAISAAKTALTSLITIFNDNTFRTPQSSTFIEGNPICFKDTISVALEDASSFSITINNAYICTPNTPGSGLYYDGVTNFGCRNSTIFSKIVSGGSVAASSIGASTVGYYNPVLYSLTRPIDSGLCINAQSNIMTADGTLWPVGQQFIQIELLVSTLGQTLSYVKLMKSSEITGPMGVIRNDDTSTNNENTPSDFPASSSSSSGSALNNDNNNNNNADVTTPAPTSAPTSGPVDSSDGGSGTSEVQSSPQSASAYNTFRVRSYYATNPTSTPSTPAPNDNNIPSNSSQTQITVQDCENFILNGTFFSVYHPHHPHRFNDTHNCTTILHESSIHYVWSIETFAYGIVAFFLGYYFHGVLYRRMAEQQSTSTKFN